MDDLSCPFPAPSARSPRPLLGLALAFAAGLAVAAPASALASAPTAQTTGVGLRGSGGTEAFVSGSVAPGLEETSYHVAYAPAGATWCTSHGASGTPQETTAALLRSHVLDNNGERVPGEADEGEAAEKVEATVTGLTAGEEYCLELVATNTSGTAHGGQLSYVAGLPEVAIESLDPTSAETVEIKGKYTPVVTGYRFTAYVEYASATSEWCTSHGVEGSASQGKKAEHDESEHTEHFVDQLTGLTAGAEYCVEAVAEDSEGKAVRSAQTTFEAGAPSVSDTSEEQIASTSARIEGAIDPAEQETAYSADYGLSSSEWCTSGGASSTPEHVVQPTSALLPPIGGVFLSARVELTGLIQGAEYCTELTAKNASGTVDSGQLALPLGAPRLGMRLPLDFIPREDTVNVAGVSNYKFAFEVIPNGEETEYFAEYGAGNSEWCRKEGDAGAPEGTTPAGRLAGGFGREYAAVELVALSPNANYCVAAVAANAKKTARNFEMLESWSPLTETISLAGGGSGMITGEMTSNVLGPGAPISCPGACTATYLESTPFMKVGRPPSASLTATPAPGSSFAGWSGDCTDNDLSIEVAPKCCPSTEIVCAVRLAASANTTLVTFDASSGSDGSGPGTTGSKVSSASTGGRAALRCTLSPNDRAKLAHRKKRHRLPLTQGVLSVSIACDQNATVTVSGALTEHTADRHKHGQKTPNKTLALAASKASVQAGTAKSVPIRLPSAAIKALRQGVGESVALALSGSGMGGSIETKATIAELKLG